MGFPLRRSPLSQVLEPALADQARETLARHAWRDAYDLLSAADRPGALSPEELELLAQAAWWVGKLPIAIEARERGYAASVKAGDKVSAATFAVLLGHDNVLRAKHSVASAWLKRAERLLEGMDENPGHGWLAATRGFQHCLTGRIDEAYEECSRAEAIAARFGDRDLEAMALSGKGVSLVARGQIEEGLAILDEASVAAVAGGLDPAVAGGVCCATISTSASLGDWQRAAQWTEAQDRWCQREGINGYPGMCRLYRAEIKNMRGTWLEAEAEARRASDELEGFIPAAAAFAFYQIGEIRLRRGDLPAAEEALIRAHALGQDPEPALSLLRLAQGRVPEAKASIARAVSQPAKDPSWARPPNSDLARLELFPAQVEIALAAGDRPTAQKAAEELGSLAERLPITSARAAAATAAGAVQLAGGDAPAAARSLGEAIQLWSELEAPYEAARVRLLLAEALAADGDVERARMETQAARTAFEQLGANPGVRRADELLAGWQKPGNGGEVATSGRRAVKTFMFTDIVDSTRFAELLGDESWAELIRWHDHTLRSLVAEHGGQEIKSIGDGFFLAFDDVDLAIDSAIAIQRRLADHRRTAGFAPAVRIGIHRAEATRAGLDYSGRGVNEAARIGASASGAEVVVSSDTLAASRRTFREEGRRTVELKGIAKPVEIVSIGWR
jgi:class 3 adenylate cyclase